MGLLTNLCRVSSQYARYVQRTALQFAMSVLYCILAYTVHTVLGS